MATSKVSISEFLNFRSVMNKCKGNAKEWNSYWSRKKNHLNLSFKFYKKTILYSKNKLD